MYECPILESHECHELQSNHLPLSMVSQGDAQSQSSLASTSLHSLVNFLKASMSDNIFLSLKISMVACDSFHENLINGSDSTLPSTSLATSTWTTRL
ncbi:unnamed protein product, partial [Vitis vinifera]